MPGRMHVLISGHVQGVGFRFATLREAQRKGLTGWVRNLSDGRVEAEFEGTEAALDAMYAWCHMGPAYAHVTGVECAREPGEPRYQAFGMR